MAKVKPPKLERRYDVDEHEQSAAQVAQKLGTHVDASSIRQSRGLAAAEAARRLESDGANALTPPRTTPEWLKYLRQYTNPLLFLLIIAAILAFVSYAIQTVKDLSNIYIGCVLVLVVVLLTTVSYLNERKATKVAESLKQLLPSIAIVVRDGQELSVSASTLVVGDLVKVKIGTRVPADLKVIESRDLQLDFSSLTGESDPVAMSSTSRHAAVHESRNIAFMSSQVVNGEGYGIVVRCGDATFIGNMNELTFGTAAQPTNLAKDMRAFVTFISVLASVMAVVLFGVGLARGSTFVDAFVGGLVTVLVANIPQGLPATVTAMLANSSVKMRDARVVLKRPDIVASLGAATRIASDKTGTLTQNRMSVVNCWLSGQFRSGGDILACAPPRGVPIVPRPASRFARLSAGVAAFAPRTSSSFSASRKGGLHSDDVVLKAPGPEPPKIKTDSPPRRFGEDLLSRMSVGRVSGPSGASFNRTSMSTFTINLNVDQNAAFDSDSTIFSSFSALSQLLTIACCNNQAQFAAVQGDTFESEPRHVLGDATDGGLLRFCDALVDVDSVRAEFSSVFSIPFNSRNKWALTMTRIPGDEQHYIVMIKGAPEYVVQHCTKHLQRGKEVEIGDEFLEDMQDAYQSFGMLAERVIGHAFKIVARCSLPAVPTNEEEAVALGLIGNFTFSGLLSLVDPPRPAVAESVRQVRRAGVAVTMVTGDHPLTAEAIARKCNIITTRTRREVAAECGVAEDAVAVSDPRVRALIVTGAMIEDIKDDEQWDQILDKDELVFARTTPQQKLLIVGQFQRRGDVVAVTGDGVNDAPALRRADIGIAMGNPASSEVARDAADVVLLDDDFSALVLGIAEGRVLYDNLKKTIAYTMTHILPETYAVIINLLLGMPLGLGAMLVLTIDLASEQGPAGSLALEPPESNLMERPPRDSKRERLVNFALLNYQYFIAGSAESLCCLGAYLWTYSLHGVPASAIFWLNPKRSLWLFDADSIGGEVTIGTEIYSPERQAHIARQANTAWYMTIILCQFWHIWLCKTRRVSIFKHAGVYTNKSTWVGVLCALMVMFLCAYTPALQENIFYSANPPGLAAYVPNLFFLVFMLAYTETVKAHARNHPNSKFTRYFAW